MKFFEGILHLVPGDSSDEVVLAVRAGGLRRTSDMLRRLSARSTGIEPEYDFGFFGSLSKRRLQILKRLAKRIGTDKAVKIVGDFATQDDRDRQMRRARVIVQIRKHEEMGLVSSSRCNTALSIGRPVVAEPHALSKPWDQIVKFSDTLDSFYDTAILVRSMWRPVHAQQLEALKTKAAARGLRRRAARMIGISEERGAA